jgi:hypothetical protein
MTTSPTGNAGKKANPGRYVPRHFIKRVARFLVQRAAVRRQQSAPARPPVPFNPEDAAKRAARLSPAAVFLAGFLAQTKPGRWQNACLMSAWDDGSLDQALQALRAADPRQAVKMLNMAMEQIHEPLDTSEPDAQQAQIERQRIAQAIRTTRLMMANPQHCPAVQPVGAPALSLLSADDLAALLSSASVQGEAA